MKSQRLRSSTYTCKLEDTSSPKHPAKEPVVGKAFPRPRNSHRLYRTFGHVLDPTFRPGDLMTTSVNIRRYLNAFQTW